MKETRPKVLALYRGVLELLDEGAESRYPILRRKRESGKEPHTTILKAGRRL